MKLFDAYDSPSALSRTVMAAGDLLSRLVAPRRPAPRLPLDRDRPGALLLMRLDGIGDNVCSFPALSLLRRRLPLARIVLAVGPWAAPLYRECPWIDELVVWDSGLFGLFRGKGLSGLPEDLSHARELKGRGFAAGIDLRGDLLSIVLLRMIGTPVRVAEAARGGARLLTDPLRLAAGHEALRTLAVVSAALGLPAPPAAEIIDWPRPLAHGRAVQRLEAAGWDASLPSVALCPQALWRWKKWPMERFVELAARLNRSCGLQVVWFMENAGQAQTAPAGDPVFCGPLDEVAAALALCRLAVSNDSGLMHLAVAAGCRTVQLFGPGDAARFGHHGSRTALLHDTSCRHYPCTQNRTCRGIDDGWCLEKIGVEEAFDSCLRLLTNP